MGIEMRNELSQELKSNVHPNQVSAAKLYLRIKGVSNEKDNEPVLSRRVVFTLLTSALFLVSLSPHPFLPRFRVKFLNARNRKTNRVF